MVKCNKNTAELLQQSAGLSESASLNFATSLEKLNEEIENKFASKKQLTETLGIVYEFLDFEKRSERVFSCGTFLEFKVAADKARLTSANFCRDRLCPLCNWRRSMKIFSQVSRVLNSVSENYDFVFLTLTVRNCSAAELPDTVSALYDGWRYLYNKNVEFRKVIHGTFRSLEITRNKVDGTYHPHLHCTLAVKRSYFKKSSLYITHERWTELWRKACKLEYNPIVHVQKVFAMVDGKKVSDNLTAEQRAKAAAEASKYAVKGSDYLFSDDIDLCAETVQALLKAISGRRLCGWTGVFAKVRKQLDLDDCENGDLIHTDSDGEIRDDVACMIVRYHWRSGVFVCSFQND